MSDGELIVRDDDQPRKIAPRSAETVAIRVAKEVEGAMVIAKRFPRDEFACIERIKKAFQRVRLAEAAEYEFPRGGSKIVGPSAHCLRAVKAAWGNIQSGWIELERQRGRSSVLAYAFDLETNARAEVTFQVQHLRDTKKGTVVLTDERDIYECVANMAARRERKCLEDIIPADVIDEAVDAARATLKGTSTEPIADRVRKMVSAFSELGVTIDMLEKRLGHKLSAVSENQLAGLRRIWTSLHDGVGKREDFFKPDIPAEPAETAEALSDAARSAAADLKKLAGETTIDTSTSQVVPPTNAVVAEQPTKKRREKHPEQVSSEQDYDKAQAALFDAAPTNIEGG